MFPFTATVVKFILKSLVATLHPYHDRASRYLVSKTIKELVSTYECAAVILLSCLQSITSSFKGQPPSSLSDKSARIIYGWISQISTKQMRKLPDDSFKILIGIHVNVSNTGLASGRLKELWSDKVSVEEYAKRLAVLDDDSVGCLILWSEIVAFAAKSGQKEKLTAQYKDKFYDIFVKQVIGSKTLVSQDVMIRIRPVLQNICHDDFKKTILPAVSRFVLRSPEIAMNIVPSLISFVNLDLSQYSQELGKMIGTHLFSKDDQLRSWAVSSCKAVAQQCSDSGAIETLLKHFFAVYGGSEGKLTVLEHRLGVISGIGGLSHHAIVGKESAHSISISACDRFIAAMKNEINETILLHLGLEMQKFCRRLHHFPDSLVSWYKSAITAKTTTPSLRAVFTSCLSDALTENSINDPSALEALTLLTPVCQKNSVALITQMPVVAEGLKASLFLLRAAYFEPKLDNKVKSALTVLTTDASKVSFFTEKFISSCGSDEVLLSLNTVIERLFIDHESKLEEESKTLLQRVIVLLLTHRSHEVRKKTITVCKGILSHNSSFHSALLNTFLEVLIDAPLVSSSSCKNDAREDVVAGDNELQQQKNNNLYFPPAATQSLQEIAVISSGMIKADQEKSHIIFKSFLPAHVPLIFQHDHKLWMSIIKKVLGVQEIDALFSRRSRDFLQTVLQTKDTVLRQNCIESLARFFPEHFMNRLIQEIVKQLQVPDLMTVSKTDTEIFLTPDGVLYETAVIDMHKEVVTKNIKKESKLYSYKEQMEELAIRQELESKKDKESVLNKKQQEAMAVQLEKESAIRSQVRLIDNEFSSAIDNLRALLKGNSFETVCQLKHLISPLVSLFSSNLCAERACQIYEEIGSIVFKYESDTSLHYNISYAIFRQRNALRTYKENWNLNNLIQTIQRIASRVIVKHEDSQEWSSCLTAPAFAFLLPLLSSALTKLMEKEDIFKTLLDIIGAHARMREEFTDIDNLDTLTVERANLRNPKYLPQYDMFNELLVLLGRSPYHFETDISVVLRDVARSCNGDEESSSVSPKEITVLIASLLKEKDCVRLAALDCLLILSEEIKKDPRPDVVHRVFVAQFDYLETAAPVAKKVWSRSGLVADRLLCRKLLEDVYIVGNNIRPSIGLAMTSLLESFPEESEHVFTKLVKIYRENNKLSPAVIDTFGRPVQGSRQDLWQPRMSVAVVLTETVHLASKSSIQSLIKFFIPEALSDRNAALQTQMLEAAIKFVNSHGQQNVDDILTGLQKFLDSAPNTAENDAVRRSIIVLMGNLAKHMDKDDSRVKPIVVKLIESLSTPSQLVQEAVANCLPALVPSFRNEAPDLLKNLMELLFNSESSYGERKGAAYGIAGLVKGLGILSLKQLGINDQLMDAIQDKTSSVRREGALFAFEMLCNMLGRLFEPYIIHILPHLLICYGDKEGKVRKASDDTSKAVMKKLSAHGVKLVLPSLLSAIDQEAWRTKVGSVTLLGLMSHCAPKQLTTCLPSIVPKLMENVLSDPNTKVRDAGIRALKQIGSVIRNPEIKSIVPTLLAALEDPGNKTNLCLQRMLSTKFVHFIDAPSLALIMPVMERAFNNRSAETRKMASQIIGNMYSLTDQKDLAPYLPCILPGLKSSLIDPGPEVRGVASRALGAMVKGMGEEIVKEIMPWLLETLTSEGSSVDRCGAAQGLAEVIGGLGLEKLNKFMPEIISTAERTDIAPHVKDGYIMLLIYLPMVFNKDFIPHIGSIISPILKALADESEFVRETALRAGQRIVQQYADSAVQYLLPELEQGLFDDNWRIRYSSIQLIGDLLYKISGVTGKMTTETVSEDDNFGTEDSFNAILSHLGMERRNRVLSGLYMGRSDVSLQVRQTSLHVWKIIVTNTPRTIKEILPTLFGVLLGCLASNSEEKKQIAARTLGDLVRKLGERVLPEMIPVLEQGLKSDRADQRQGVCIGLSEIISSTSRETVQAFADSLVPTVTKALYDPLPEVRTAAGKTFESLHSACGGKVLDEILPKMLHLLGDPVQGDHALDGLKQIMTTKGKVVLPYLIPQLTAPPVNTRALSLLSESAGDALAKHLPKILPALLTKLSTSIDTPDEKQELEYCQSVILAVNEDVGVRTIIDYLLDASKASDVRVRRAAVMLITAYSQQAKNINPYVSQLLRGLIFLFTDQNESVLTLVWEGINSITKSLDARAQMNLVTDVRSAIRYAVSDVRPAKSKKVVVLPGLSLTKGIGPILPVFREAILNGSPEQKELAAQGLSELIEVTSPEALKPSVINIAGPLIRILGDRYAWSVKVSVLDTLSLLLEKVGNQLRPFLPQLQQTFLKALADAHKQVRLRSANALSNLVRVHAKCDSVLQEIHNLVKGDDVQIKETALFAMRMTLLPAGDKIADSLTKSLISTVTSLLASNEDSVRIHAAACLGCLVKSVNNEDLSNISKNYLFKKESSDPTLNHGCAVALRIALKVAPEKICTPDSTEGVVKALGKLIISDRVPLIINGLKGCAYFFRHEIIHDLEINQPLITAFSRVSLL